jgi:hypothetical protein
MGDIDQHDDSAEESALSPEGGGEREPGGTQDEPAEGDRDDALREEQQGKGYGARYGDDEGERDPTLTDE